MTGTIAPSFFALPTKDKHHLAGEAATITSTGPGFTAALNALVTGADKGTALLAAREAERTLAEARSAQIRAMREMLGDDVTHAQRVELIRDNLTAAGPDGLVTDSLAVAELYRREHKNVLRNIREIMEDTPGLSRLTFEQRTESYVAGKGQLRERDVYTMNRVGFGLLSASFKGRDARRWTAAYIEALETRNSEYRESGRRQENDACFGPLKAHRRMVSTFDQNGKRLR